MRMKVNRFLSKVCTGIDYVRFCIKNRLNILDRRNRSLYRHCNTDRPCIVPLKFYSGYESTHMRRLKCFYSKVSNSVKLFLNKISSSIKKIFTKKTFSKYSRILLMKSNGKRYVEDYTIESIVKGYPCYDVYKCTVNGVDFVILDKSKLSIIDRFRYFRFNYCRINYTVDVPYVRRKSKKLKPCLFKRKNKHGYPSIPKGTFKFQSKGENVDK